MWEYLPDLLLEDIFLHLNLRHRFEASLVCSYWNYVFNSPRLWRTFHVKERTFTYKRFNLYKGFQFELNHDRVQKFLGNIAQHIRHMTICPIQSYYNLYEYLHMMVCFFNFFDGDHYPMPNLLEFHFTFACEDYPEIVGTGGQVLNEVKQLLGKFQGLEKLSVNNLLLSNKDARNLLDDVVKNNADTLLQLQMLNCTKEMFPFHSICGLTNLRRLIVSPTHLADDLVLMLSSLDSLRDLVVVQDRYTPQAIPVASMVWLEVKQIAPQLRLHLHCRGRTDNEILLQENAPVETVLYDTPYSKISANMAVRYSDNYRKYLRVFAHYGLPRKLNRASFHDRCDTHLLLVVRECPYIHTLVIRERISTMTLLILATEAKNLNVLHVRRNAVMLKSDWPRSSQWTEQFYQWLKVNSRSYELVEEEVARILGTPWKMLPDKAFKALKS